MTLEHLQQLNALTQRDNQLYTTNRVCDPKQTLGLKPSYIFALEDSLSVQQECRYFQMSVESEAKRQTCMTGAGRPTAS